MKRTRQRFDRPEQDAPSYTSGCLQFEGEDLRFHERAAVQNYQQKEWAAAQKRELAYQQNRNANEAQAYADQTEAITRMRGMLEDEATAKKAAMMRSTQQENLRLAQAKRNREECWRKDQQSKNASELDYTLNSDIMTENFQTTASQHAGHRYVPYHFKALRPDQIADIDAQRAQQCKDLKQKRKFEKAEEHAWATQLYANNQKQMQNEIDMSQEYKEMNQAQRDTNKGEKNEKDKRWPNMYCDLDALPVVDRNLDKNSAYVAHYNQD